MIGATVLVTQVFAKSAMRITRFHRFRPDERLSPGGCFECILDFRFWVSLIFVMVIPVDAAVILNKYKTIFRGLLYNVNMEEKLHNVSEGCTTSSFIKWRNLRIETLDNGWSFSIYRNFVWVFIRRRNGKVCQN